MHFASFSLNAQVLPRHSYSMFLLIFLLPLPTSYLTPILHISEILFSYGFCFPVSFATSWSLLLFLFLCVYLASVSLPYQLHMFSLCVTFIFLKRKNLSSSANHIYTVYSYFAVLFAGPPHRSLKRIQINCFWSKGHTWFKQLWSRVMDLCGQGKGLTWYRTWASVLKKTYQRSVSWMN